MEQNKKKSFFYCIKPLLLLILVNYAVSFIFVFICRFVAFGTSEVTDINDLLNVVVEYSLKYSALLNIICAVILLVSGLIIFIKKDYNENDRLYDNKLGIKGVLTALCAGIGMFLLVNVLLSVFSYVFDMSALLSQHENTMQALSGSGSWLDIAYLALLAPICEEVLVRGLCFNRLRMIFDEKAAVVFSAVLFGILHYTSFLQMFYTFAFGLVLAYGYTKFENIIVPILMHMSFNMMNFVFEIPFISQALSGSMVGYAVYYVLCVAFCVIAYKLLRAKQKPPLLQPSVMKEKEN